MRSIKNIFSHSKVSERSVYIVAAKRTPIGALMGKLSHLVAPELGSKAIKGALESIQLDPKQVDQVIMGNVLSAGQGQGPARQASLRSGLGINIPCTTINKVCSSGLKSIVFGAQSIALGDANCVITGGFQSMSNSPHVLLGMRNTSIDLGNKKMIDTVTHDVLIDPFNGINMGLSAEKTANDFKIGREIQDQFCKMSYQRALNALKIGVYQEEIIPISGKIRDTEQKINYDEQPQRYNERLIPFMAPIYSKTGTITNGNSTKLNDGGCALILMSQQKLKKTKVSPLAKIIGYSDASTQSIDFSISSYYSIKKVLQKTGIDIKDINFYQFNQAYAVICLVNMQLLGISLQKVNINGGAIALGHPIAMSGARIVQSLLSAFRIKGGRYGLAAICNGGGGSTSMIIQNLL